MADEGVLMMMEVENITPFNEGLLEAGAMRGRMMSLSVTIVAGR